MLGLGHSQHIVFALKELIFWWRDKSANKQLQNSRVGVIMKVCKLLGEEEVQFPCLGERTKAS